jgi:MOSC domain-containing protein YiiM
MRTLRVIGLQVGKPRTVGSSGAAEAFDREWTTGFYKMPCEGRREVSELGIEEDGQADLVNHGGVDKAVCVYPTEHYEGWSSSLGLELSLGAFGENLSVEGMVEQDVRIGAVFACGDLLLEVSQPRQPCWKLARRWRVKDLAAQVERTGRTGWYFRVLKPGALGPGDVLTQIFAGSAWSVAEANRVMHQEKEDWRLAAELAQCPQLSLSWQTTLKRRGDLRLVASSASRTEQQ